MVSIKFKMICNHWGLAAQIIWIIIAMSLAPCLFSFFLHYVSYKRSREPAGSDKNITNYFFSFQCQPERYYGFQSQNQHLFTFLSLDSSTFFTLQTEPKTAASSIRLLMNSKISTALQLFAGVHTATGGQDSSFNSLACTFSCELRWSCWFPHFSCSVHNSPQILRQVPPGTWWWCGPPGGGEKQSSVHRAVTTTTTTTTRQTRSTLTM